MSAAIERLFRAFLQSVESLETYRGLLKDALIWKGKYPGLLSAIRHQYDSAINDHVAYFYRAVKKSLLGRRRVNPPLLALEKLETMFVKLRNETLRMKTEAKNFYIGKQLIEAKASSRRVRSLLVLAQDAADTLASEFRSRGAWNDVIVKELQLLEWVTKRYKTH